MEDLKFYMNNPCEVLRKINDDFSEVCVYPQFDEDMNGGEWCTECMIGNQGTPSTHTCGEYQEVIEAIRDAEPKMIVVVENRLLANEPIEFKSWQLIRDRVKKLSGDRQSLSEENFKLKTDNKDLFDSFVNSCFDYNDVNNEVIRIKNSIDDLEREEWKLCEKVSQSKSTINIGGVSVGMSVGEFKELIEAKVRLDKLVAGGVDNWEWYGESLGDNIDEIVSNEIQSLKISGLN